MFRIYDYIFYKLYIWSTENWTSGESTEIRMSFAVAIIQFLNIYLILVISQKIFEFNLFDWNSKLVGIIICGPLIVINYYRYLRKNNYKHIIRFCESYQSTRMNHVTIIFVIFSFIAPFTIILL